MPTGNLAVVKLFAKIYVLVLALFTSFRLLLFIIEWNRLDGGTFWQVLQAFFMGLRFDLVISSYLLILPFFVTAITSHFTAIEKAGKKLLFWVTYPLFTLAFLVCTADIPYFSQFVSRFSVAAFGWFDSPVFVVKMIAQESKYWWYVLLFALHNLLFFRLLRKTISSSPIPKIMGKRHWIIPLHLVLTGLIFLAMRGRLDEKSPIKVGTAYFSNNAFLNQLGLNPNFTLLRSYLDSKEFKEVKLMNPQEALHLVQLQLGADTTLGHPLARTVVPGAEGAKPYNVVLVLMESMSAHYLARNNPTGLTPFLDSLSNTGWYFENAYSAGIHTFNGIFSTLFSYPAIAHQHAMKESNMQQYNGLSSILKKHNYSTIYFTTHDGQFDNVEGFLRNNQFETVISKPDYPQEKVKTTLGVPDHEMFAFSMEYLDQLAAKNQPFLSVYMTASNHVPHYVPEEFTPHSKGSKEQVIEYSDWSIQQFVHAAAKKPWFKNTLFVFVADHGFPVTGSYDVSLDYVQVPLIFYNPQLLGSAKTYSQLTSQLDIGPSILHLLNLPYTNTSLGQDVFSAEREFVVVNQHEKYGVFNQEWLLILYPDKAPELFKYRNLDKTNYAQEQPELVARMKQYAYSMVQTADYINQSN